MAENTEHIKTASEIKGDEEVKDPRKRRDIIKTIIIVFLAVLLVLTFFSNTIMNRSLAEITSERATSGKLTERIRGSGMVMSNQSWDVTVDGNKTIESLNVKNGKEVKKGDVLMTVSAGDNEALTAAEDALAALELDYQKAILTPAADYSSENQSIQRAREDLQTAIAKRDAAVAGQSGAKAAKEKYESDKQEQAYYTKLQTKLQTVIAAIDSDEYSMAPAEYTNDILAVKSEADTAEQDYTASCTIYTALTAEGSTATEAEIAAAREDMEAKETARNEAREKYETEKFGLRADIAGKLADAETEAELYAARVAAYESENNGGGLSIDDLNADVTAKQRTLEDLITTLSKTQKTDENTKKMSDLDLQAKKKEVDKAREKVDKLRSETGSTEVISKYSGVISNITVKVGDTTLPDNPVMTVDLADEGYTMEITVEADKAKKVKKGTQAEVVNNWFGGIEATLTDIKSDTVAGSKSKILVFALTGDVDSGSYLELSIPCGGGNYDSIVPKNAIGHDKDGDFVLVVVSKNSPLGNRYYAERVAVEVLASDETSSAVSGNLGYNEYVITASSKPVEPKDQVRMKDK
ncbi:MAG: biotin/lipoyl-binding protein [Ruminococcus sp.]|nr:biotin/lipoyl-binding protein [Ruminococcus sp.]